MGAFEMLRKKWRARRGRTRARSTPGKYITEWCETKSIEREQDRERAHCGENENLHDVAAPALGQIHHEKSQREAQDRREEMRSSGQTQREVSSTMRGLHFRAALA